MFSFLIRTIGIWMIAIGIVALVNDISIAFSNGSFNPVSLGKHLHDLIPAQLNLAQAVIQRYVAAWLWDPVIQWILIRSTFAVLIAGGLLIYFAGRIFRKKVALEKD